MRWLVLSGELLKWQELRVGLLSNRHGRMSFHEPGLDALFRICASAGCSVARSAAWFGADSDKRGGRLTAGYVPHLFFKAPAELQPG